MKILELPLKSEWYLMIELGVKLEEYREIKPYWYLRLYQLKKEYSFLGRLTRDDAEYACDPGLRYILKGEGFKESELKGYTHVRFRYGYTKRTMLFKIEKIIIGRGNPEWGAPTDKDVFIIRLGERVE